MGIGEMTLKDFEALPHREEYEIVEFSSLVVLPAKVNDDGYRCMDFVAVKNGEPICRLSGVADALHTKGGNWSVNCLPKSGLLLLWPSSRRAKNGLLDDSDFDVISI